jgi:hypothetical protein
MKAKATTKSWTSHRLSTTPTMLRANGWLPPDYRAIREAALNCRIPAYRVNNIWHYDYEDLDVIAAGLGLVRAQPSITA